MLGDKLGETKGRITSTRVLEGGAIENNVAEQGTILGVEVTHLVTFATAPTASGALHAVGHGVFMTADGEAAPWEAKGIVTPKGPGGAVSVRGALLAKAAPHGKLARLNRTPVLFEADTDSQGNLVAKFYEWK